MQTKIIKLNQVQELDKEDQKGKKIREIFECNNEKRNNMKINYNENIFFGETNQNIVRNDKENLSMLINNVLNSSQVTNTNNDANIKFNVNINNNYYNSSYNYTVSKSDEIKTEEIEKSKGGISDFFSKFNKIKI